MASSISIPRRLPLLFVGDSVLLPGSSMRIPVRNMRNMNMVKSRLLGRNSLSSVVIGVVCREPADDRIEDIHPIGTAAVVVQVTGTNWPAPSYTLLITGLCRFKVEELIQETPYPVARVRQLDKLTGEELAEDFDNNSELRNLASDFREQAAKLVEMLDISVPVVAKLKKMLESLPSQHLPDITASIVKATYSEKLKVLDAVNLSDRFKKTLPLLVRQIEGLKLLQKAGKTNAISVREPRQTLRRPTLRRVPVGRGETLEELDEDEDEIADLEAKIKAAEMPELAEKAAIKELKRLKKMPPQMPEHAMIRNYLELCVELPWNKSSNDTLDISQARLDLDADHYGLEKVKKRVIEYLAVRQLKNSLKGPILCFVGPPGVGKTSIGKSIAQTLGREFHRISLGGCCDQSDIRGHRRTYIGSMPGRIVQGIKQAGTNNPVMLLDEVDKLGRSYHGDPAAALLEVLDPEQNHSFVDHYLNTPFDLSQVLFIATANTLATIPHAMLDRMELIHIPGYTQEEKVHIAMRHLIPKQLKEHGLTKEQIVLPEDSVKLIVSKYTREAGVRTLERQIGAVCRAVAVRVAESSAKNKLLNTAEKQDKQTQSSAESKVAAAEDVVDKVLDKDTLEATTLAHPPDMPIVIDEQAVEDILGPPMYELPTSERLSQPGVAVGLAWTAMGGEILFVEASQMSGEGKLTLTGQLGDVMKESANLALNWVRAHAKQLGIAKETDLLDQTDIHIHFPAGAVGKDGPSAGVTIVTVLVSLFTKRCVRSDTAMTGEVTLRGLVLPVGGIKEKMLGAHRAGISRVILPKKNEKDLHEVPDNVKGEMKFKFATRLEDVLNEAFEGGFPGLNTEPDVPVQSKL